MLFCLTRELPTGEVTMFFVLNGVCTAAEVVVKKKFERRLWRMSPLLSRVLTLKIFNDKKIEILLREMELKLYNTYTQQKEVFRPINPGKVGLYVCGITAYDFSHIGHARAAVPFDVLYRFLMYLGYEVTYVRNFTDVDNKIIERAKKNGEKPLELSNRFCHEYLVDMGALQCLLPTHQPRVSDHMDHIIKMIQKIIENGCGYAVEGGDVFFSVDKSQNHGKLSGQLLEHTRAGERVAVDSRKRNPADFALWKAVKPDEPSWESPWGPGRPGWHIEFDIHGGGADLIFPHHENELAQTCAACGEHGGVNYWLHNGHLTINNEKMSKSKGDFKPIREVTERYHPLALRHFLISVHYRSPLSYSASKLDSSSELLYYVYQTLQDLDDALLPYREAMSEEAEPTSEAKDIIIKLKIALKFINDSIGKLEKMQEKQRMSLLVSLVEIERGARKVLEVLGLLTTLSYAEILKEMKQKTLTRAGLSEDDLSQLIQERIMARKKREFEKSDVIRAELAAKGIALMDVVGKETVWRPCLPSQATNSSD
ncbi:BnaC03g14210D [Brassica napus]|uniref:cysteine--tRNA ligase n=1 Tax=Brassica napus TaxID=3708 RepID=A0A078FC75_BRANA|nr:BnaC03g14210D [Brassica napus]